MRTITITTALFALLGPGMLLADDVMQAAPKAQSASSLQITLRLGSTTALPGITDGIWLDVRNNGSSPATFSDRAALQVVTAEGEPFIPYGDNSDEGHGGGEWIPAEMPLLTSLDSSARSRVLAPGETKTFLVHEGLGRPFMCDDRMNRPGVYRLRLVVDEGLSTFKLRDKTRVLDQEGLVSPLVSNEVVLTVREPEGDDAKAWALREQRDGGSCRWNFNVLVAEKIWASYPTSAYAFFSPRQRPFNDYPTFIAQTERAVAIKPDHPAAELRRIDISDSYGTLVSRAMQARNVQLAIDYAEKRRELLLGIVRRGINPRAQMLAVQALDGMGTREQLLAAAAEWDRPPRVKAYVDCIEPLPGVGFKAWLNYDNSTDEEQKLSIGERNKFTPGPFDRGQPQTFVRGLGWYFSVTSDGRDLMWHIDGQNLKVSAKKLMDPPDPDYGWENWTEQKGEEKRKATFRCAPGFAPDPFKLHETAMQSVPQVPQ